MNLISQSLRNKYTLAMATLYLGIHSAYADTTGGLSGKPSHDKSLYDAPDAVKSFFVHVITITQYLAIVLGVIMVIWGTMTLRDEERRSQGFWAILVGSILTAFMTYFSFFYSVAKSAGEGSLV